MRSCARWPRRQRFYPAVRSWVAVLFGFRSLCVPNTIYGTPLTLHQHLYSGQQRLSIFCVKKSALTVSCRLRAKTGDRFTLYWYRRAMTTERPNFIRTLNGCQEKRAIRCAIRTSVPVLHTSMTEKRIVIFKCNSFGCTRGAQFGSRWLQVCAFVACTDLGLLHTCVILTRGNAAAPRRWRRIQCTPSGKHTYLYTYT
jgi:hypothetical protein